MDQFTTVFAFHVRLRHYFQKQDTIVFILFLRDEEVHFTKSRNISLKFGSELWCKSFSLWSCHN
jgi:hypothetical protein